MNAPQVQPSAATSIPLSISVVIADAPHAFVSVDAAAEFCGRLYLDQSQSARATRDFRLRLGSMLLQVRAQLPDGAWGRFLTLLNANRKTLEAAMKLARAFADERGVLAVEAIAARSGMSVEQVMGLSLRGLNELRRQAVIRPDLGARAHQAEKNRGAGSPMLPGVGGGGVGGHAAGLRLAGGTGGMDADEIIDDWEDEDLAEDGGVDVDGDADADDDAEEGEAEIGERDTHQSPGPASVPGISHASPGQCRAENRDLLAAAPATLESPTLSQRAEVDMQARAGDAGTTRRGVGGPLPAPHSDAGGMGGMVGATETSDAPEVMEAWEKRLGIKDRDGVGRRGDVAGQMTLGALYEEAGLMLDRVRARLRLLSGDDLRALMGAISRFDGFSPETTHTLMRSGRIAGPAETTPQGVTL